MTDAEGRPRILVCGASIAALETLGALRSLAGDRVALTILAPDRHFVDRPLSLAGVFGAPGRLPVPTASLADVLGAELIRDRLAWIDAAGRSAHTRAGRRLGYDVLVAAIGARARVAFAHATTLAPEAAASLARVAEQVRARTGERVVCIAPEPSGWLLALYETALALAGTGTGTALTLVTAERAPLAIFGETASARVAELLARHRIEVICDVRSTVPAPARVVVRAASGDGERVLSADRVIALPRLDGPFLRGLPCAGAGFIPVDRFCRVAGHPDVFAAGDVIDYPVKHGGLAAQQGDVVARQIAQAAGCDTRPAPWHPALQARLFTKSGSVYLGAHLIGGRPFESFVSEADALASGPKVIAGELDRLLDAALARPAGHAGSQPRVEQPG